MKYYSKLIDCMHGNVWDPEKYINAILTNLGVSTKIQFRKFLNCLVDTSIGQYR